MTRPGLPLVLSRANHRAPSPRPSIRSWLYGVQADPFVIPRLRHFATLRI